MLVEFGSSNILVNYIKELLKDFPLPKYPVYTRTQKRLLSETGKEVGIIKSDASSGDFYYIKEDILQKYKKESDTISRWYPYVSDNSGQTAIFSQKDFILGNNFTNNMHKFEITNNIYDTSTHEYLGKYLRFVRDYMNINLMPLYNCFSNNLYIWKDFNVTIESASDQKLVCQFSKDNREQKIYQTNITLGQDYTIALDCAEVELVIRLLNTTNEELNDKLAKQTFKRYKNLSFNKPILFTGLNYSVLNATTFENSELAYIYNNLNNLQLLIKIPRTCKSSIVVLEGDFTLNTFKSFLKANLDNETSNVSSIIDFEKHTSVIAETTDKNGKNPNFDDYYDTIYKNTLPLSLLKANTYKQIPFADTLLEYLTGFVITEQSVKEDIVRLQTCLHNNCINIKYSGIWEPKYRFNILSYLQATKNKGQDNIILDALGYIDRNVEEYYGYTEKDGIHDTHVSLKNVESLD